MLLSDLCDDYINGNPNIGSKGTVQLYRFSVGHFSKFLERQANVSDLTEANFAGYIRHRKKLGRLPATVSNEAKKLLALWRYAAAPSREFVPMPTVQAPRLSPAAPRAYLKSELRRMFRSARHSTRDIGGIPVRVYFVALLAVVFDSGERIAAVLKADRSDYDLTGRWVTFRHRKQDGKIVTKKLRRATVRALRKLLDLHEHVGPFRSVHVSTVYYHQTLIQEEAGLPTADRRKFHAIRKSHASYVHAGGGDSTDSLSHSSDAITRQVYHDPRITQTKHPVDYLFSPFGWWDRLLSLVGW